MSASHSNAHLPTGSSAHLHTGHRWPSSCKLCLQRSLHSALSLASLARQCGGYLIWLLLRTCVVLSPSCPTLSIGSSSSSSMQVGQHWPARLTIRWPLLQFTALSSEHPCATHFFRPFTQRHSMQSSCASRHVSFAA